MRSHCRARGTQLQQKVFELLLIFLKWFYKMSLVVWHYCDRNNSKENWKILNFCTLHSSECDRMLYFRSTLTRSRIGDSSRSRIGDSSILTRSRIGDSSILTRSRLGDSRRCFTACRGWVNASWRIPQSLSVKVLFQHHKVWWFFLQWELHTAKQRLDIVKWCRVCAES